MIIFKQLLPVILNHMILFYSSALGVGNVKPGIEYNFYFDPEAAYIVFKFAETFKPAENNIVLIPWETVSTRNLVKMVSTTVVRQFAFYNILNI